MDDSITDIIQKLDEAEKPDVVADIIPVTFEPFSFLIVQELKKLTKRAERNRLYESILNDERASLLYQSSTAKTVLFPNHNTRDDYWKFTLEMAFALSDNGIDVCFLPEECVDAKGKKRADAILRINNQWTIADFKYFHSSNQNTLSKDLENGFLQAQTIVLKISSADAGTFREAVEYLKRNRKNIGNIILMNEYNRVLEIAKRQLESGRYNHLIKGFL